MSTSLIPCIKATEIQGAGYCNSVCVIIVNAVPVSFPVHHKYTHTTDKDDKKVNTKRME